MSSSFLPSTQSTSHGVRLNMAVTSAAHPSGLGRTKAQVLDGARTLRMHDLPLDPVSPLHVQVRIHSVGLSDSDLMHFTTLSNDGISLRAPLIVGQEATGEITVVGAMVAQTYPHLQVGLKVAIEPSIPCRTCQKCIAGKYNICLNMLVAASGAREPYVHGFLREYANWPGEMVHPLPLNVPYDVGTLTEPLARVIHAANRANLQPSTSVAVIGSGLSALLMCAYASSIGCYPVCIISADQSRMNIATLNNWASHEYLDSALPKATAQGVHIPPENRSPENRKRTAYKLLTELRVMSGYSTVFETTGSEPGGQLSMFLAERAGKIVFMNGRSKPPQLLPLSETIVREIDTVSCFGSAGAFPAALLRLSSGSLGNLGALLSHKVPFVKAESGFAWLVASQDAHKKPVTRVLVGVDNPPSQG